MGIYAPDVGYVILDSSCPKTYSRYISNASHRGQWAAMFGSYDVDIASDLPLWVAQDDWDPNVSNVVLLMGGWTFVTGKQCNISVAGSAVTAGLCMGMVDLDSSAAFVESTTSTNSVNIINAKISNHKKSSTIKTPIIMASTLKTSTLTPSPTSTSGLGSCVCDL